MPSDNEPAFVELPNDRDAISGMEASVLREAEAAGYPRGSLFALKLGLEEAITNAFKHGHASLPEDVPIRVAFRVTPTQIVVVVEDQGPGFDPTDVPDPTLDENLASPGGRGLMLMRAYMSSITHNERGNRVRMVYENPDAADAHAQAEADRESGDI